MFELDIKKKRFIILFLIIFQLFLIPRQAKALAGTYTLTTGVVVGAEAIGEVGTVATVSTVGTVAIPIAIAAIGLGVIYHNRHEIANFVTGFIDYMKTRNIDGVKDSGLTQDGKECLRDYVTNYSDVASSNKIPLFSGITVPADSIVWTSIGVNVNSYPKATFELYQTGINHIENLGFVWKVDDYSKVYYGGDTVSYIDGSLKIGSTYFDETLTCNTVRIGIRNTGSFDTECGVAQIISTLPVTRFSDVTGSYLYPDFNTETSTYVQPKTGVTYDDLVGISDSSIDTVVDVQDIPFPDTDIDPDVNPDTDIPDSKIPDLDFTPLIIGVKDKFPFCIPWDIINFISSWSAPRKEPSIVVEFPEEYFVGGGSFEFSFKNFETIIIVLRYVELLGFYYFMMKKSRALIGSGGGV